MSDSGIFRSIGELREFVLGLNGSYGKGEKGLNGGPHPSPWAGPNWTREGGAPFLPSPFPFPFLLSYSYYLEGLLVLLGMMIPTIESRESNIPMTKGTTYVVMRFDQ